MEGGNEATSGSGITQFAEGEPIFDPQLHSVEPGSRACRPPTLLSPAHPHGVPGTRQSPAATETAGSVHTKLTKPKTSLGCSPSPGYNLTAAPSSLFLLRTSSATLYGFRLRLSTKAPQATNGSGFWQTRGSADWERRLAADQRERV